MTTITYTTNYSVYEVDPDQKLIRRVKSSHTPTPRQGEDLVWKKYAILGQRNDGCLVIVWSFGAISSNPSEMQAQCTVTSPVVKEEMSGQSPQQLAKIAIQR